jgi:hypothetical protein
MKNFKNPSDAEVRMDFPGGWADDKVNKFKAEGRTAKENEAFEFVKKLANYRKTSEAISKGNFMQFVPQDGVYVYFRYTESQKIMVIANTNKTESAIGKFGVGFKAVFQYTNTPHIYDPNFQFRIERFIIPRKLDKDLEERNKEDDARVNKTSSMYRVWKHAAQFLGSFRPSSMLVNVCFSFVCVEADWTEWWYKKRKRPRPFFPSKDLSLPFSLSFLARFSRTCIHVGSFPHSFSLTLSSSFVSFLFSSFSFPLFLSLLTVFLIRALLQGGHLFLLLFAAAAPAAAFASTSRKPRLSTY